VSRTNYNGVIDYGGGDFWLLTCGQECDPESNYLIAEVNKNEVETDITLL
jgi:hypothetical protein